MIECPECEGDGEFTCKECDGSGVMDVIPNERTSICDPARVEEEACPKCDGDGYVVCDVCEGDGEVIE